MESVSEIVYAKTDEILETYPPDWALGVPTVASASVFAGDKSNDDSAEFSPTVTIDSVSTTVDAPSGSGQTNRRRVYLTATTSIVVGRRYLLENAAGQRECVTVSKVASGDYVETEQELAYDYTTADTFKGLRFTAPVNSTWVQTESKISLVGAPHYRVIWTYTAGGLTRRHYTYARLVRQRAAHSVTFRDLAEYWPDLEYEEPRGKRGQQFRWAIDSAWSDVRADLLARDVRPEQVRDLEVLNQLVRLRTIYQLGTLGIVPGNLDPEAHINRFGDAYKGALLSLVDGAKVPLDHGTEGAATTGNFTTLWFTR